MKNTRDDLHEGHHWCYHLWIMAMYIFALLLFPEKIAASNLSDKTDTGYMIVIEQKTDTGQKVIPEKTGVAKSSSGEKLTRQVREDEVRHVLGIAIAGMGIIWGGLFVAVYKIRRDRADEVHLEHLRELYETETQTEQSSEATEFHKAKVKYDRTDFYIQRRQA